jgi:hypothetical protein
LVPGGGDGHGGLECLRKVVKMKVLVSVKQVLDH